MNVCIYIYIFICVCVCVVSSFVRICECFFLSGYCPIEAWNEARQHPGRRPTALIEAPRPCGQSNAIVKKTRQDCVSIYTLSNNCVKSYITYVSHLNSNIILMRLKLITRDCSLQLYLSLFSIQYCII